MNAKTKLHSLRAVAVAAGILALLVIAFFTAYYVLARAPSAIPSAGLLVTVRDGSGASLVARELEGAGAIRHSWVFRALARLKGSQALLKAGTYRIGPEMGTLEVLDLLVSGKQALVRVTVPEGYTLRQTAALLEKSGVCPADAFLAAASDPAILTAENLPSASLEGYLFPDTYFLPASYDPREAARTMVTAFRRRLAEAIPESAGLSPRQLNDRVILASIVEREYRMADEAPVIASVFYNRIRIGMALQSCATVVYVLTEKLGRPHPDSIHDRDLKIKDPYNTYLQRGLPPGPICSPGLTSLEAVFRPAATKYLYFRLVDPAAGRHHFSATFEEHNQAADLVVKRIGG